LRDDVQHKADDICALLLLLSAMRGPLLGRLMKKYSPDKSAGRIGKKQARIKHHAPPAVPLPAAPLKNGAK